MTPKLPGYRPARVDDVTPPTIYDAVPQTPSARLRIDLARLAARARRVDRLNAAAWQREQDRRAEAEEAARERRSRGR